MLLLLELVGYSILKFIGPVHQEGCRISVVSSLGATSGLPSFTIQLFPWYLRWPRPFQDLGLLGWYRKLDGDRLVISKVLIQRNLPHQTCCFW